MDANNFDTTTSLIQKGTAPHSFAEEFESRTVKRTSEQIVERAHRERSREGKNGVIYSRFFKNLAEIAILAAAYFAAGKLGLKLASVHASASAVWPPSGITLAAFLLKELEAFSYSVSHDLSAPLRGIDGFSQALLEDYADKLNAQGQDYLQRVRSASQRMAQLIHVMLNLSRVTRTEMRHETVDLSAIARIVAAEFQQMDPKRRVEFVIANGMVAHGDARLLQVMLENLFGNAWKFTGKHPSARIEFGMIPPGVEGESQPFYFVRDDGTDFDMAYADKLFRAFQRLHAMTEFDGTGIGLATVQRIIQRHGGRIWAEGEVERGATFYFTLPIQNEERRR